ncbi:MULTISPECIES: YlcG family protein [Dickeya]|uniref:YlcG family protein n=1 Tax=Dickeya solani TaxID=1089444 RepID=A0ABU4EMV4_9GAMM|nr:MULTISPECIES: YlcG family protein [Dickeya]MCA6998196.1 YlcG family protein [Dickeya solani]MDV6997173.1 YlcG family protein [Dickeya solani]MDV7004484.1 YlcG family protein [Dickeya solani]MDV7040354.1 YlcG family protein [Dickeya solani]MDV7044805.1 YlcG family protein [Dickeya solani]
MKNITESLRLRWCRLRIYRYAGSVVIDYRILRNFEKTLGRAGA